MNWKHLYKLDSALDLIAAAEKPIAELGDHCRNKTSTSAARSEQREADRGNVTFAEALEIARKGWKDAPRLDVLAEQIAPTETRPAFEMQHAVSGAFVDVSRYLEGHPENMLEFCEEPAPRHVTIGIQIGKNANITPAEIALSGAVSLAVMDTLAKSGIAADVFAVSGNHDNGNGAIIAFPIKRAAEPLDLDQLAFWLCHAGALRKILWSGRDAIYSREAYEETNQSNGRGYSTAPPAEAIGADYMLSTTPKDRLHAAREYHRIISELSALV